MDPMLDTTIDQVVMEKIDLAAATVIERDTALAYFRGRLRFDVRNDPIASGLVVQLRTYLLGMRSETIDIEESYPANWWQACRERWLPKWWLRRWPVEYRTISIHKPVYAAVCPHMDALRDDYRHVRFMYDHAPPSLGDDDA